MSSVWLEWISVFDFFLSVLFSPSAAANHCLPVQRSLLWGPWFFFPLWLQPLSGQCPCSGESKTLGLLCCEEAPLILYVLLFSHWVNTTGNQLTLTWRWTLFGARFSWKNNLEKKSSLLIDFHTFLNLFIYFYNFLQTLNSPIFRPNVVLAAPFCRGHYSFQTFTLDALPTCSLRITRTKHRPQSFHSLVYWPHMIYCILL